MSRRVVVTGMGVVCPLGNDVPTYWRRLLAGESGVGFIEEFPTEKLRSNIAAMVRDFDAQAYLSRKETEIYGRVTHFSYAAAVEALSMAGLGGLLKEDAPHAESLRAGQPEIPEGVDRTRIGCLMSTGMGSVDIFEQQTEKSRLRGPRAVSPFFIPGVMPNGSAALIAMRFGLMGPSYSLNSACATGTHSIATSALMIEAGEANVMVAGGGEAATRLNTVAGFGNARALARAFDGDPTRASRPFDQDRSGFVMGEGAGALVLELEDHARGRGAKIFAYVAGFGMTTDAQHLTRPHDEGLGVRLATERALERAGIATNDVGYINPHATSTPQGDAAEVKALRQVFGSGLAGVPISATKSMVGHTLGGAGAIESIAVVCTLRDQKIHPSINIDALDESFDIDVVTGEAREVSVRYALKVSAGFGGHNCALVFESAPT
ncbi:MAG: beta-ketoacyl-[acyl-carrier-protein] synthase family protein [Polyangiaceae bacterium]